MFDTIARRYDLLNRVLSGGIDQSWRRKAVAMLRPENPRHILDLATGTADLAIQALVLDPERVVGVDFSSRMLEVGRAKIRRRGLDDRIQLVEGDAENLPFGESEFDAILVAFGVRNFGDLGRGLAEMRRVLRPGGCAVVLEFSHPTAFPMKQAYAIYSRYVLPRLGGAISGDAGAYRYLPDSVAAFPDGEAFLGRMEAAGFRDLRADRLTFGVASLYFGRA
jgi:demethylmenaquinone methyltransferase/2-methoxy-6-polyprenyl-1,4-benzoquinol methylase